MAQMLIYLASGRGLNRDLFQSNLVSYVRERSCRVRKTLFAKEWQSFPEVSGGLGNNCISNGIIARARLPVKESAVTGRAQVKRKLSKTRVSECLSGIEALGK